jgi:hypothetical protein
MKEGSGAKVRNRALLRVKEEGLNEGRKKLK